MQLKSIFRFLLPHVCILCREKTDRDIDLCDECEKTLPFIQYACQFCGKPLAENVGICGQCLQTKPPVNFTAALLKYKMPVVKLIHDLKFSHQLVNAKILGELMTRYLKIEEKPHVIIPIPLHKKRLRERGFNQAVEIARPIAKYLKIPIDIQHCRRTYYTKPQATIHEKERKKNIKNAFKIHPHFKPEYVAILDDVVTTGNTIFEFARVLQKNGIKKIDVWTVARTD